MTNEQRAHNLAVSYAQYKNIAELLDDDSMKLTALEADYFSDYDDAYEDFLSRLEDK